MRPTLVIACVLLAISAGASGKGTVPDVRLDATFARGALAYLRTHDSHTLDRLGNSEAAAHLLRHARNFNYGVPKDSPRALAASLLVPNPEAEERCRQSIAYFTGPMSHDRSWLSDTLRYLPDGFKFNGTLFLTYGYDIGVAFGPTASLNCAHRHFGGQPRELLYYAIHELHHVGFMAYQPPPRLADIKTCADLLRLVEYSTQVEGMAVLAAYDRRRRDDALADDPDYLALQDDARMRRNLAQYFADVEYLKRRETEPADAPAWAVIDRMSSGERLWYRVGARMAQQIEAASGHAKLMALIRSGPRSFLQAYTELTRAPENQGSGR